MHDKLLLYFWQVWYGGNNDGDLLIIVYEIQPMFLIHL